MQWMASYDGFFSYSDIIVDRVVLLDHVSIGKFYIDTFTRLLATKLDGADFAEEV